jgi:hypothetical protein
MNTIFQKMNLKLTGIFSIAILGVIFLAGCSKSPEKALPQKNGKWTYTLTGQQSTAGIASNYSEAGVITFTSGGTGIWNVTSSPTSETTFTWTYDDTTKRITIAEGSKNKIYDISAAERKSEKWHYSESSGTTSTTEDLTLVKQ